MLKFSSLLTISLLFISESLHSETKPHKVVDTELEYREYMVKISRQLGVTCNYCHDVKDFKSSKLPPYGVSKDHMRIVDLLNQQGFRGRNAVKADCFLCHRGLAKPNYKEKIEGGH
jgi:hypothetical protein